ncbi:MAG TPA: hypothetical protein VGB53_17040 [Rubricoccaceae bacterium]|jgi:hypothetical protein
MCTRVSQPKEGEGARWPSHGRRSRYTAAKGGSAQFIVLDALGREVAVVHKGYVVAGERVVGGHTSKVPAGVYVICAEVSGRVLSARPVVAR